MAVDTLSITEELVKAGESEKTAKAHAHIYAQISEKQTLDFVTKKDLDNAVLQLENKISRMTLGVGAVLGVLIVIVDLLQ